MLFLVIATFLQAEAPTEVQKTRAIGLTNEFIDPEKAYEVVELFAHCAAAYRIEAEIFDPDMPASATFRRQLAIGAELVSQFIASLHYEKPVEMTAGLVETRTVKLLADIEVDTEAGIDSLQTNLAVCVDASLFQKQVIDSLRQTISSGSE